MNVQQIMTIDKQILHEKIKFDVNREGAKIFVLSSGTTEKYKYFTVKEIVHSDKITYSSLKNALKNQAKNKLM